MNRQDTLKILAILKAAYPQHYRGMTAGDAEAMVALWTGMFDREPYAEVEQAVKAHIATDTKGFCPVVGAIKEQISRMHRKDGALTEHEAWELVRNALKNGYYGSQEEYAKLPSAVQKILGGPSQLRDWSMLSDDQVNTVIASNFMRSYRARAEYERDVEKLPEAIRQNFLPQAAQRMELDAPQKALPGGEPAWA